MALPQETSVGAPASSNVIVTKHYEALSYAAFAVNGFKQMINSMVRQKKYDSSNPYWVDCFFGTLLTHGLDSDLPNGQRVNFNDIASFEGAFLTTAAHKQRRSYYSTNDSVFTESNDYFSPGYTQMDYAIPEKVA